MKSGYLPPSVLKLISELKKLPNIGEKSALRIVLSLLRKDKENLLLLAHAFKEAYEKLTICKNCFNLSEGEICQICEDNERDKTTICIVEEIGDLIAIERTRQYKGLYHVLGGLVSPSKQIKFEDLTILQLKNRVLSGKIKELILALNPTLEGEATSLYIKDYLKDTNVKVTRIALGIPMGSDIEYLDEITMAVSLLGRKEFE